MTETATDNFWTEVRRQLVSNYRYKQDEAVAEIARYRKTLKSKATQDAVEQFDEEHVAHMLGWHNRERYKTEHFSDNCLVARKRFKSGKEIYYSCEYFQITFREYTPTRPELPYEVAINRYCVPGRIDTYFFDYESSRLSGSGDRVRYYSEGGHLPMTKAIKMLEADLNRDNVVKMLVEFCETPGRLWYTRVFVSRLLACVGRSTKAYRVLNRLLGKLEEQNKQRIAARQAEREQQDGVQK